MQQIQPVIRKMTPEERSKYQLQNFGMAMEHKGQTYRLSSGHWDNIHVFTSGATIYVLTVNTRLDYMALDAYIGSETDPIATVFMQYEWELEGYLGKKWKSLAPATSATKLIDHLA